MTIRITKVHNPVAAYNRRRPIVEKPHKGKGSYNRKEDEKNADKHEKDAYKKGE
jgi:stalled ribosome alternative rescue factor ArfA